MKAGLEIGLLVLGLRVKLLREGGAYFRAFLFATVRAEVGVSIFMIVDCDGMENFDVEGVCLLIVDGVQLQNDRLCASIRLAG